MKLPGGAPLEVVLAFAPDRVVAVGRLGSTDRRIIFEQRRAFLESGLMLHPFFSKAADEVLYPPQPRLFDGLHGVFADSLPDAWGRELLRRRAHAAEVDVTSLTALDRLAWIGSHGPGALTYRPAIAEPDADEFDLDRLADDALSILEGRDATCLDDLARLGGSSGGARPKIAVAMNDRGELRPLTGSLPPGFEAWMIKFRHPADPRDSGPIEAAYADMARAAGLDIAETRLLPSKTGPGYFATKRFDRVGGGRLHMVSAPAMLEIDWSLPGDYETLLKVTRRVTRDQKSVEDVFRRGVFNFVAHNRDDHWKQHAFLMDRGGTWSVAPSFDLTFSNGPSGEHYLTMNGRGTGADVDAFVAVGANESIDRVRVMRIFDEVATAVARFPEFARRYDVASARAIVRTIAPNRGR